MKLTTIFISFLLLCSQLAAKQGVITGGENYSIPDWFKLSLLDLIEDAEDSGEKSKHLILFMHLKACPYCTRMLKENFRKGDNKTYMQKHFDVIAINIRGDKEISWKNGKIYSEILFAKKMGVFATPTIVFLDTKGRKVLQLNGYRKPQAFRDVLEYIHVRHYRKITLAQFIKRKQRKAVYSFLPHPYIKTLSNMNAYQQPLAIIFENRDCADCAEFHKKVLNHTSVLPELKQYLFVRLNTYSQKKVFTPSGRKLKPAEWAKGLGLNYRPGLALYNKGKLISLINGRYYHFHFKENLRYVSGGHYKRFRKFSLYLKARQKELLNKGININLSE